MLTIKILAQPRRSLFAERFPFYHWKRDLLDSGIKIEVIHDHLDVRLKNSECVLIQSKYFTRGWQNLKTRTAENEEEIISYLVDLKKTVKDLIWFDQADSSGSSDFAIIKYVDKFVKKQVLKDVIYYADGSEKNDLRLWLNSDATSDLLTRYVPCPPDQLYKVKLGWNIGFNDYRQFLWKFKLISNAIPYKLYPLPVANVDNPRTLDLTFRGKMNYDVKNLIAIQRNRVHAVISDLSWNITKGSKIKRGAYLKELKNSRVSISPFGFGEICYRDYETFISGALLIKPSMDHVITYPDMFIPNETYIPIAWDVTDLAEVLDRVLSNFSDYRHIAVNAQQKYLDMVNKPDAFLKAVDQIIK
ncbi:MAG: hypothetical protein JWN56_539 [Sphingobacteriales bacterium]|nr:hypothetical protein [Sphingobacteriales bacterium]